MRLLAIDAASKFGWAFGETSGMPISGHGRFAKEGADSELYYVGAWNWMHKFIHEHRPEAIVIEATIPMMGRTTLATTKRLHGIQACLRCNAYQNHVFRQDDATPDQVRAYFTPLPPKKKGEKRPRLDSEQKKLLVRRRCIELGFVTDDVTSLDQTDALAVWAWGVNRYDPESAKRFLPLFQEAA
jgi:hypothetical protein